MGLGSGIRDPGSEIRDPEKTHRIQGSKRHRIPDPQHWLRNDLKDYNKLLRQLLLQNQVEKNIRMEEFTMEEEKRGKL
jgi:hypothetical protein